MHRKPIVKPKKVTPKKLNSVDKELIPVKQPTVEKTQEVLTTTILKPKLQLSSKLKIKPKVASSGGIHSKMSNLQRSLMKYH